VLSVLVEEFKISQYLAKLHARSWLPHVLSVPGQWALSHWKMKNLPDILSMARNSCC